MLADVAGGQHHRIAEHLTVRATPDDRGNFKSAVGADGLDTVGLAVDRATLVALVPGQVPPVAASLHQVTDPGEAAVPQRHPFLLDTAESDEFGSEPGREFGGLLVGVGQQQRAMPGEGVGQPRSCRRLLGLLDGPGVE